MPETNTLPLEDRTIKVHFNGVWKEVPAIHKTWCVERAFPRYLPPVFAADGSLPLGARETWLELVHILQSDLIWLLSAQHHVFWSQVLFNKPTVISLVTFLQEAPPAFCHQPFPYEEMEAALRELSRLVFLVFCRLIATKENNQNFISPKKLGDLLYDNYILTIPSLLDLCAVYGASNREGVKTILQKVINLQPKYLNDLEMAGDHLSQILDQAKQMLSNEDSTNPTDVLLHVYDSLSTVRIFLELCPQGHMIGTSHVLASIATFYASSMPQLTRRGHAKGLVEKTRVECIRTVRGALGQEISKIIIDNCAEAVERYLAKVSELLSEGLFVLDYHAVYPIDVDLDVLVSAYPDMDTLKIDYILEALCSHTQMDLKPIPAKTPERGVVLNYPQTAESSTPCSSSTISGVELQSLITEVQDILPHLGTGFIEKCLNYFEYSTERVIAAVLESKLPAGLEESNWESQAAPLIETERSNVFNHDEFDVMDRDHIDKERVHRGKKPHKHKNANDLLSDKTDLAQIRDKFANLGFIDDDMYDDEYDDTYESLDVAIKEPDAAIRTRRPFVTPRVLQTYEVEDDEDEEEPEQVAQAPVRDAFVANPEDVRARLDQKRNARRNFDVVGRAKGQGQDKQVLINREKKNVNKSSGSNHHRRSGASRKRNQGMIPS